MASLTDLTRPFPSLSFDFGSGDDLEAKRKQQMFLTKIMKYVYWIVGLTLLSTLCYVLYNKYSRCVSSVLIFIGGILALYYYFIKWFYIGNTLDSPKGVSLCPDYLTPVSPGFEKNFDGSMKSGASGVFKCVDFVGVSTNGALLKSDPMNVELALSDPRYHLSLTPDMTEKQLKAMLKEKGLTWISMFNDDA
jgi:hypothetical protein